MIANNLATEEEISELNRSIKKQVREGKKNAWRAFLEPYLKEKNELIAIAEKIAGKSPNKVFIMNLVNELKSIDEPIRRDVITIARKILRQCVREDSGIF